MLPKVFTKDKKIFARGKTNKKPGGTGQRGGAMSQMSEAQETEMIIKMTEAGITAYCESCNIPVEVLRKDCELLYK